MKARALEIVGFTALGAAVTQAVIHQNWVMLALVGIATIALIGKTALELR